MRSRVGLPSLRESASHQRNTCVSSKRRMVWWGRGGRPLQGRQAFERTVEVIGDAQLALEQAWPTRCEIPSQWHQPRHRTTALGDEYFVAAGHILDQPREVGLGLMDVDLAGLHSELSLV